MNMTLVPYGKLDRGLTREAIAAHALIAHEMDGLIMTARCRARLRGATPAEIERNVLKYSTDEPADCIGRDFIGRPVSAARRTARPCSLLQNQAE